MIYGNPTYNVVSDRTDRVGIRTIVMAKPWEASRWPMTLDELSGDEPLPYAIPGGMEFIRREVVYTPLPTTHWTYMGVHGDGKDVTFKTRQTSHDYKFQPGFSQVDIALHPKLQQFLKTYQGQVTAEGEIYFPPLYSPSKGQQKVNPLFGETSFLRMEGTYTFRYVSMDNTNVGDGENLIHEAAALPGKAPSYKGRNWLKAPTQWQRLGPVYEIMETYWLSGPSGWPVVLYGDPNKQAGGGGSSDVLAVDNLSSQLFDPAANIPSGFSIVPMAPQTPAQQNADILAKYAP